MLGKAEGMTEDEVGWDHQLNGHEFEQAPGDSERQGSLVCCSPWGQKELDTTERLNNSKERERRMTIMTTTNNNKTLTKTEGSFTAQLVSKLVNLEVGSNQEFGSSSESQNGQC